MRGSAFLVAVLAIACGSRPLSIIDDGGGDGANRQSVAGPSVGGTAGQCDYVAQRCGNNQRCAPDCMRRIWSCAPRHPEAGGRQGFVCGHDDQCAPGFVCLAETASGGSSPRCAGLCRADGDCARGTICVDRALLCERGNLERRVCVSR